jgi:hypothetical protein
MTHSIKVIATPLGYNTPSEEILMEIAEDEIELDQILEFFNSIGIPSREISVICEGCDIH